MSAMKTKNYEKNEDKLIIILHNFSLKCSAFRRRFIYIFKFLLLIIITLGVHATDTELNYEKMLSEYPNAKIVPRAIPMKHLEVINKVMECAYAEFHKYKINIGQYEISCREMDDYYRVEIGPIAKEIKDKSIKTLHLLYIYEKKTNVIRKESVL